MRTIRSLLIWGGIGLSAITIATMGLLTFLVTWPFDKDRRIACIFPRMWARAAVRCNPLWRCDVDAAKLKPGRYVVVSNHQSLGDIIVSLHLPHHFKFISKSTVFQVPVLGWYMNIAGYIPLQRKHRHSIADAMNKAREWLNRGVSVLFYPEGTRSPTGELRPFKHGAFKLAVDTGSDVLPVLLDGAADLLPRHSFHFSDKLVPMRLVVGDVIPVAGLGHADVERLADTARAAIARMKVELDVKIAAEQAGRDKQVARAAG